MIANQAAKTALEITVPIVDYSPHADFQVDGEQIIWRYLTLEKLLSLLVKQSIYFSQIAVLQKDDPFEGNYPAWQIEQMRSLSQSTDKLGKYIDENRHHLFSTDGFLAGVPSQFAPIVMSPEYQKVSARLIAASYYVSCWHMNDEESAALWQLYCSNNSGIAIRTTVDRLKKSIITQDQTILIGRVSYANHRSMSSGISNFRQIVYSKRPSFEHEKEIRLTLCMADKQLAVEAVTDYERIVKRCLPGIEVGCDVQTLIGELIISPLSPDWYVDTVTQVVNRLLPGISARKSGLFDPPNYGP